MCCCCCCSQRIPIEVDPEQEGEVRGAMDTLLQAHLAGAANPSDPQLQMQRRLALNEAVHVTGRAKVRSSKS